MNILHVVGTLLHGIIIAPCSIPNSNHQFGMQPLPCYKSLWEARTTREWRLNSQKYCFGRQTGRTLIMEDVMNADKPAEKADPQAVDKEVQADVVRWCENMDALGTLLYMVLPLERKRQGGMPQIWD